MSEIVGCSLDTIFHVFTPREKKPKQLRFKFKTPYYPSDNIYRKLSLKVGDFKGRGNNGSVGRKTPEANFSREDVLKKIGEDPVCYLTGDKIDLSKSNLYSLDHIIPSSKGGDNSLGNLNIAIRDANLAKGALTLEVFISLCKRVVKHNS